MTQRPLFDPSKMAVARRAAKADAPSKGDAPAHSDPPTSPAQPPGAAGADLVLTVSQLASRIDSALKSGVPAPIRVVGEVSGFRDRTHWYFDLKDAEAIVNCAMFANAARKAEFQPANGQQILARGRIDFYAKGGKVTLIVEKIEPVGEGALEIAFRKLCEELRTLGYFAVERKRPLPRFPRRIAVVTSRSGAALQDVLVTMRRRCPAVGVLLVDARMQGDGAAPEIAAAISRISRAAPRLGVDALLVTRGGGSKEDLWAFNERVVADAVLNCSIPVVAAIGHETDTTIAELVADERCATPTQAAMRLTPDTPALLQQLDSIRKRLGGQLVRHIAHDRERLRGVERFSLFAAPRQFVAKAAATVEAFEGLLVRAGRDAIRDAAHRLTHLETRLRSSRPAEVHARNVTRLGAIEQRLARSGAASVERAREKLDSLERQLRAVGPLQVLDRGYSVTLREDGRAVHSSHDVRSGDVLKTLLADGSIRSVVDGERTTHEIARRSGRTGEGRRVRPTKETEQPGLFGMDAGDQPR